MNPDNALGRIKESLGETDQPKNEDGDILDGATIDTDTNYSNTKKALEKIKGRSTSSP